jgi:hypothetical protein
MRRRPPRSDFPWLTSNPDEGWNALRFAPATITLDLGEPRHIKRVLLLPDMKPSSGIVRHRLELDQKNAIYEYCGVCHDRTWICIDVDGVTRSIKITTTMSPSWVAWRQIQVIAAVSSTF